MITISQRRRQTDRQADRQFAIAIRRSAHHREVKTAVKHINLALDATLIFHRDTSQEDAASLRTVYLQLQSLEFVLKTFRKLFMRLAETGAAR